MAPCAANPERDFVVGGRERHVGMAAGRVGARRTVENFARRLRVFTAGRSFTTRLARSSLYLKTNNGDGIALQPIARLASITARGRRVPERGATWRGRTEDATRSQPAGCD